MPVWSCAELQTASQALQLHHFSNQLVKERYEYFGGIARSVLDVIKYPDPASDITSSLSTCAPRDLLLLVTAPDHYLIQYAFAGPSISTLVHVSVPTEGEDAYESKKVSYIFASNYVRFELLKKFAVAVTEGIEGTALAFVKGNVGGNMQGIMMEFSLHITLSQGGSFNLVDLEEGKSYIVKFPTRRLELVTRLNEVEPTNTHVYYVPDASNFPVVDAFLPPRVGVQITVSTRHTLSYANAVKIMRHLLQVSEESFKSLLPTILSF